MKVTVKGEDRANSVSELIDKLDFYRNMDENVEVHISSYTYSTTKNTRYSLTITWEEER